MLSGIIGRDAYLDLNGDGVLVAQGKQFRYEIRRNQKTVVVKPEGRFSACIGLSDRSAPDTDRIAAEYLLIKNDEQEYLQTANLSPTRPPISHPDYHYVGNNVVFSTTCAVIPMEDPRRYTVLTGSCAIW